jgi:CubicO group peptidase (beta-lactamase class C family)
MIGKTNMLLMNIQHKTISFITCVVLLIFNNSCDSDYSLIDPNAFYDYSHFIPEQTSDGWVTGSLSNAGIDGSYLVALLDDLDNVGEHRIHSILIVKDERLVFEEYFPGRKFNLAQYTGGTGFDREDTHNLASATKSFVSACIGITIDKGFLQNVDQRVFDLFPEYDEILISDPNKSELTVRHLLTMTSGLEWDDETIPYSDPRNDLHQMFVRHDPIRYVLEKELTTIPGTVFDYANCNTNVLGEIVKKVTNQRLDEFAAENLFSPLGITKYEWQMLPNNVVFASGDLRLRPRDMAKFGLLFLNNGIWNSDEIISQEWIEFSTAKHIEQTHMFGDGYWFQWWLWDFQVNNRNIHTYMASGWGGQWIIVVPDYDMVVVTTGGNYYDDEVFSIQGLIIDYILPAVRIR